MNRANRVPIGRARQGTRGMSGDELRRHNLATVLARLHFEGPITRSEITSRTELNRSTIGDLIGELADLGLAAEGPATAPVGPGRPSPVVAARPSGAVVLAVEIDVDSMAVATVGLGGHVYNRLRVSRESGDASPQETVREVAALAQPLIAALPASSVFVGIGVAVAGVTRRSDGHVHLAPNLGWNEVPLGEIFATEMELDRPAFIGNEADLGAVGEFGRGPHGGSPHLVYVSGGVGIGAGVIVDGRLLDGVAGYAGEAGHMIINPGGQPCRCGGTGCWETEAGEAALFRAIEPLGAVAGVGAIDALVRRTANGDDSAISALAELGRWLGIGIANLINIFNPEVVVLGGFYETLFPFIEPSVVGAVDAAALDAPRALTTITNSSLGQDAPLMGAAESVLADVIADPTGTRLVQQRPPTLA